MVPETNNVACKPGQRRCPKSMLTALTCDYLTALVALAAAPVVKTVVLPSPTVPAWPASSAYFSIAETDREDRKKG